VPRRVATTIAGLATVIVLSIAASAAVARQSFPDSHGVFHACYGDSDGEVRVVTGTTCANGETAVTWNATGPRGVRGLRGFKGNQGDPGPEEEDQATKSTWTDVAQGARAIAEIVALIVGGLWAYFLFIRGRIFSRRLEPLAEGELLQSDGVQMLRVRLRVKNAGASIVKFADDPKAVYLYGTGSRDWLGATNVQWSKPQLILTKVLENHKWIEGGETILDEVLVPVPDPGAAGEWLAYRLDLKLASRRQGFRGSLKWTTTVVVPGKARPVHEPAKT
jgi:hypothetical protein